MSGTDKIGFPIIGYASIINAIDASAYAVPVLRADKALDVYGPETYTPLGDEDKFVHDDCT